MVSTSSSKTTMIFEAGKGWLLSAMFQVRKEEGAELLRGLGAKHVVVTSREAFSIFFAKFNFFFIHWEFWGKG